MASGSLTYLMGCGVACHTVERPEGCRQTNENSHRIAGAALIYALNNWRHSARAAARFILIIGALIEVTFLKALHTLNLTPHPAPVAPLADPTTVADRGDGLPYRRVTLKNVYIDARAGG